ncbi:MAG: YceI family protein [Erythrobacter sp.]|nr:YceI family protein [Erythrobacter sp.]
MRNLILAAATAGLLATAAVSTLNAQAGPEAGMDTSRISAGTYAADPNHSMVAWGLNHLGFNNYYGIYGNVTGTLNLDPANLANASVDVMIPLDNPTVASAGLHDHLLRAGADGAAPDFFGPSPEAAHFVSTMVHPTSPTTAEIMGNLTFNGQTHPVTIEAELAGMGTNMMSRKETVGFHGSATITRSQWGLGWGTQFGLGDDVQLHITAAFEKQ